MVGIDVGGGTSRLVDELLTAGYDHLTVLNLSRPALETARSRLGDAGSKVSSLAQDITEADLPPARFDLWHDRAVFHFLTTASDRQAYVVRLRRSLRPGGRVIMAAFAESGPERIIGRPLQRSSSLTFKRESIARGIGIGLLVGLTPTVGLQTMMMLAGCPLVRGNFPAAFAISWVSNPLTLPPMIYAYHELGEWLFGSWVRTLFEGSDAIDDALIGVLNTALGTALIAVPVALIGYFAESLMPAMIRCPL
ncbi:MAG: DUF2062 domain-containing protein [Thioalkalivibrio sp.]|nr:DUF2062 domain-containing protein [Thioalkalivibrio sp.]